MVKNGTYHGSAQLAQPLNKHDKHVFHYRNLMYIEQLGVKEEEVSNEASFVDDLGADSLDTVELVMALEEEFKTEIPDEEAEKITTVQQAIDYITKNLG